MNEEITVQNRVQREATNSSFTIHSEKSRKCEAVVAHYQTHAKSFCGLIGNGRYFCDKLGVI